MSNQSPPSSGNTDQEVPTDSLSSSNEGWLTSNGCLGLMESSLGERGSLVSQMSAGLSNEGLPSLVCFSARDMTSNNVTGTPDFGAAGELDEDCMHEEPGFNLPNCVPPTSEYGSAGDLGSDCMPHDADYACTSATMREAQVLSGQELALDDRRGEMSHQHEDDDFSDIADNMQALPHEPLHPVYAENHMSGASCLSSDYPDFQSGPNSNTQSRLEEGMVPISGSQETDLSSVMCMSDSNMERSMKQSHRLPPVSTIIQASLSKENYEMPSSQTSLNSGLQSLVGLSNIKTEISDSSLLSETELTCRPLGNQSELVSQPHVSTTLSSSSLALTSEAMLRNSNIPDTSMLIGEPSHLALSTDPLPSDSGAGHLQHNHLLNSDQSQPDILDGPLSAEEEADLLSSDQQSHLLNSSSLPLSSDRDSLSDTDLLDAQTDHGNLPDSSSMEQSEILSPPGSGIPVDNDIQHSSSARDIMTLAEQWANEDPDVLASTVDALPLDDQSDHALNVSPNDLDHIGDVGSASSLIVATSPEDSSQAAQDGLLSDESLSPHSVNSISRKLSSTDIPPALLPVIPPIFSLAPGLSPASILQPLPPLFLSSILPSSLQHIKDENVDDRCPAFSSASSYNNLPPLLRQTSGTKSGQLPPFTVVSRLSGMVRQDFASGFIRPLLQMPSGNIKIKQEPKDMPPDSCDDLSFDSKDILAACGGLNIDHHNPLMSMVPEGSSSEVISKPGESNKKRDCNACHSGKFCAIHVTRGLTPTPLLSSDPAKPFQCGLCGKCLASKNVYQLHMRSHSGEKPFTCNLCGHHFSQKTSLTRHMRSHTGERPFPCDVCGKRFADKERIKIHMRTHTGEKPFACEVCGKQFSQKSTVKRHMSVHTGEKPFKCETCGKGFANRGNLNAHTKTHANT